MNNISGGIHNFFSKTNALTKLIIINVAVFVCLKLLNTTFYLFNIDKGFTVSVLKQLSVPAAFKILIHEPWSVVTYMFLHQEFFHIFFNMLWLYYIGSIFLEYLGGKKLISTYLLGGIAGALLYILAFNIFPAFRGVLHEAYTMGASASVLAIIIATATLLPDYKINLLFFQVPLKYLSLFYIAMDLMSIGDGNAGGHIAHLGGAIYGYLYIKRLQKGVDMGQGINVLMDKMASVFSRTNKIKVVYNAKTNKRPLNDDDYAMYKKTKQEVMDKILDKISQSGYDSLSKEEKEFLFKISKEDK